MRPAEIIRLVTADLRAAEVPVEFIDGWEDRGRPFAFNPRCVRCHHTATKAYSFDYPSLGIVRDGRSDLPGPLAQFGIGRHTGTVYVIAAGYANDGGEGGWKGLSGNGSGWGIEAENDGIGEEWNQAALRAYVHLVAALCRHSGIGSDMVCFPPGTLVLCKDRLRPIEEVEAGHEAWTHRGRWRRITATMTREADTVMVRGRGHPGLVTTASHPFMAFSATGLQAQAWSEPQWVPASRLVGQWWASPAVFDAPAPDGDLSPEALWMLGYCTSTDAGPQDPAMIVCRAGTEDEVRERCAAAGLSGTLRPRPAGGAELILDPSPGLTALGQLRAAFWAENGERSMPTWLLALHDKLREAFLDGVLHAGLATFSRPFAVGLKLLAQTLGFCITLTARPSTGGAGDHAGSTWVVGLERSYAPPEGMAFSAGLSLGRVESVSRTGRKETVYNLAVEEDESYVADGLVVHNCGHREWSPFKIDPTGIDMNWFRGQVQKVLEDGPRGSAVDPWAGAFVPVIIG